MLNEKVFLAKMKAATMATMIGVGSYEQNSSFALNNSSHHLHSSQRRGDKGGEESGSKYYWTMIDLNARLMEMPEDMRSFFESDARSAELDTIQHKTLKDSDIE